MNKSPDPMEHPLARSLAEIETACRWLAPFQRAGYRLFPLRIGQKIPRDKGWQTATYRSAILKDWLWRGGNVGIALGPEDLVLDIDPRNGGSASWERLQQELGLEGAAIPAVLSGRGDGGRHLYFKKPSELRVGKLGGYSGIDTKSNRGLVVAPGSRHPATGGTYHPDPDSPPISKVGQAPVRLLQALRPPVLRRSRVSGGGELSVEQLEMLLAVLDPRQYGHGNYERWISFAAACHDATDGYGLEVWLDWSARDENYGHEAEERNIATWNSFTAGRLGGTTYVTILKAVARAGRYDLVKQIEPNFFFDEPVDENVTVYTL